MKDHLWRVKWDRTWKEEYKEQSIVFTNKIVLHLNKVYKFKKKNKRINVPNGSVWIFFPFKLFNANSKIIAHCFEILEKLNWIINCLFLINCLSKSL